MRTLLSFLFFMMIMMLLAVILIVGKPSDQECFDAITRKNAGALVTAVTEVTGTAPVIYQVRDHLLWKTIYFRPTGDRVGVGILGFVIC